MGQLKGRSIQGAAGGLAPLSSSERMWSFHLPVWTRLSLAAKESARSTPRYQALNSRKVCCAPLWNKQAQIQPADSPRETTKGGRRRHYHIDESRSCRFHLPAGVKVCFANNPRGSCRWLEINSRGFSEQFASASPRANPDSPVFPPRMQMLVKIQRLSFHLSFRTKKKWFNHEAHFHWFLFNQPDELTFNVLHKSRRSSHPN